MQGPFRSVLLTNQTVDETTSTAIDCSGASSLVFYLTGVGTTSSGVVTYEESDSGTYGGTWSEIAAVNASDVTGGKTKATHTTAPQSFGWVRARISTVIGGGGDISVVLRGKSE